MTLKEINVSGEEDKIIFMTSFMMALRSFKRVTFGDQHD